MVSSLPVAAVLATWLDAFRAGDVGPDDLADAVRGDDPRHLVSGLGDGYPLELHELPTRLDGPVSLALPSPGDPVGLGGPSAFNLAAIDAGQAVVAGAVGLVPHSDARTVVWSAFPADRVPWVDERETAIALRTTLTDVTGRLVALDVASWQPDIPDLLMNLRHRRPLPLPRGTTPGGSRPSNEPCCVSRSWRWPVRRKAERCRRTRWNSGAMPWETSTVPHAAPSWAPARAARADRRRDR